MEDAERLQIRQSAMCSACDIKWRDNANCADMNPDTFDITKPEYDEATAKKACGECAVRECCLEYALAIPEKISDSQIWGGLTGEERKNLNERPN